MNVATEDHVNHFVVVMMIVEMVNCVKISFARLVVDQILIAHPI